MLTVLEIIRRTTEFLASRGVESPRLSAEHLVGHALGLNRMRLYLEFERPLTEPELVRIRPLVKRRSQREPLQHILGEVDFAGVRLKVDRRALIPRPETELLVEVVASWAVENPPVARIADLGTGTGAIALGLAERLPSVTVLAVDREDAALTLARENGAARSCGARVEFVRSDWFTAMPSAPYDIIVSNPPYLSEAELVDVAPEVRDFEPRSALVAAEDGLGDLLKIISGAGEHLRRGGLLALETGPSQHAALIAAATAAGYSKIEPRRDLAGRDRFILAVW
jgi:release factor glutamine methyltransferase